MSPANPLCPCRKTGAWRRRADAQRALDAILADPDQSRPYQPSRLDQCPHGIWHLTSKASKPRAKGKTQRKRGS